MADSPSLASSTARAPYLRALPLRKVLVALYTGSKRYGRQISAFLLRTSATSEDARQRVLEVLLVYAHFANFVVRSEEPNGLATKLQVSRRKKLSDQSYMHSSGLGSRPEAFPDTISTSEPQNCSIHDLHFLSEADSWP